MTDLHVVIDDEPEVTTLVDANVILDIVTDATTSGELVGRRRGSCG